MRHLDIKEVGLTSMSTGTRSLSYNFGKPNLRPYIDYNIPKL